MRAEDAERRRGGRPVCHLADLDPVEAASVLCLRSWFEGPEARAQIIGALALASGAEHATLLRDRLEALFDLFQSHSRRPLMRHDPECACVGADEACFAGLVGAATDGAREDAMLMAALILRADMAPMAAGLAQEVGLCLRRAGLRRAVERSTLH